jgi:hypothetical protein
MTTKLRSIRTASRAASVKRRDVACAVKQVVIDREAATGRFADRKSDRKTSPPAVRK